MENCNCPHCQQLTELGTAAESNYRAAVHYRTLYRFLFGVCVLVVIILFILPLFKRKKEQASGLHEQ